MAGQLAAGSARPLKGGGGGGAAGGGLLIVTLPELPGDSMLSAPHPARLAAATALAIIHPSVLIYFLSDTVFKTCGEFAEQVLQFDCRCHT